MRVRPCLPSTWLSLRVGGRRRLLHTQALVCFPTCTVVVGLPISGPQPPACPGDLPKGVTGFREPGGWMCHPRAPPEKQPQEAGATAPPTPVPQPSLWLALVLAPGATHAHIHIHVRIHTCTRTHSLLGPTLCDKNLIL